MVQQNESKEHITYFLDSIGEPLVKEHLKRYSSKRKGFVIIKCQRCNVPWKYRGDNLRVICPNCKTSVGVVFGREEYLRDQFENFYSDLKAKLIKQITASESFIDPIRNKKYKEAETLFQK